MTRKHYIMIAKILRDHKLSGFKSTDQMILDFCAMLKMDNRNFNAQKFIDAVNKS